MSVRRDGNANDFSAVQTLVMPSKILLLLILVGCVASVYKEQRTVGGAIEHFQNQIN